jgi:hypothetical protein
MNAESEIHDFVDQHFGKLNRAVSAMRIANSPVDVVTPFSPKILSCARPSFLKFQKNPRRPCKSQHAAPPSLPTPV